MADNKEVDEVTGTETTGHEWDGIRELNTPLPRWWLYILYASIVVSVVYWVLMPAWPLVNGYTKGVLGFSDRANVAAELEALQTARAPMLDRLAGLNAAEIAADPELHTFARAAGEAVFGDYCRTCHGPGGGGAPGYPVLADDVWIWGGTLDEIEQTLRVGVRADHPETRFSQMPAFGRDNLLTRRQIGDVTEYVISISRADARLSADRIAAQRGAEIYGAQCAVCHGGDGGGDQSQGAPSLRDDLWLYGGSRDEIRLQVETGRGGVMPAWESRFDAGILRALAIYVHDLGGGQADPAPMTQDVLEAPGEVAPAPVQPETIDPMPG